MPSQQPFQPDAIYCVYCHAEAAGACGSCGAIVCADCTVLQTAAGKSFAICKDCSGKTSLARGWISLVWPIAVGLVVLGAIVWLLRR